MHKMTLQNAVSINVTYTWTSHATPEEQTKNDYIYIYTAPVYDLQTYLLNEAPFLEVPGSSAPYGIVECFHYLWPRWRRFGISSPREFIWASKIVFTVVNLQLYTYIGLCTWLYLYIYTRFSSSRASEYAKRPVYDSRHTYIYTYTYIVISHLGHVMATVLTIP